MGIKTYISRALRYIVKGTPIKKTTAEISYLQPNGRLVGKRIIITGGGRGIGASMAEKFVSEGAEVLIAGRDEKKLKELSEKIGCKYLVLDVSKVETFQSFIKEAENVLGGINCLVNNAGISLHENTFFEVTPKTFDQQINTNLRGAFFLTQEFIKLVEKNKRRSTILFTSSETGDTMDFRPYGFTKAAVNSMVQGLAYLFAKDGIRINAIAPGITASDMTGYANQDNIHYDWNLIERIYLPEEVAETACFLLSEASGCISGQIIVCNNAKTVNARWK